MQTGNSTQCRDLRHAVTDESGVIIGSNGNPGRAST